MKSRRALTICAWALACALILLTGCAGQPVQPDPPGSDLPPASDPAENSADAPTQPEETSGEQEEYPYDYTDPNFFAIEYAIAYAPKAELMNIREDEEKFWLEAEGKYGTMQGASTDGTYGYFVLENQVVIPEDGGDFVSECYVYKVDLSTWEIVDRSESLAVDHGNDTAYNPNTGLLAVAHTYDHPQDVSLIDTETLEVVDRVTLDRSIYGITYNANYDQYVVAIRGQYDFAVLDGNFQELAYYEGVNTGYTKQGMTCDDDYIYFIQSGDDAIVCYNWEGEYCGVYRIAGTHMEAENIFHSGDDWYVSFNVNGGGGGWVYRITFDKSLLK